MHREDSGYRWFYQQEQTKQLTGTAQRLWCCLYDRLGIAHANRFYEMSSKALAQELGVCLKSVERARKALQQAGFLHYEVRGKSVYYMLRLPETLSQTNGVVSASAEQQNQEMKQSIVNQLTALTDITMDGSVNGYQTDGQDETAVLLQQILVQLQDYILLVAQLQAQWNGQQSAAHKETQPCTADRMAEYTEYKEDNTGEYSQSACENTPEQAAAANTTGNSITNLMGFHGDSLQDKVYTKILQSRQFLDKREIEVLPAQPLVMYSSADFCTYKQQEKQQTKLQDILFNDKYEILLWDYLDKYKDNRFAEACYNHFAMVKEIYRRKGKKQLTEFGFFNMMEQLEELSGDDMIKKLAIMERSLRNGWVGFFPLPENTPEHHKMEEKKQGRKRSSYRKHYGNKGTPGYRSKFIANDGVDLSFLEE